MSAGVCAHDFVVYTDSANDPVCVVCEKCDRAWQIEEDLTPPLELTAIQRERTDG